MAPVNSVCDGGYTGCIADDAYVRCGIHQFFYNISAGSLAKGTDDGCAWYQYFLAFCIFTPDAFFSYFKSLVTGMYGYILVDFFQEQRAVTYVGIGCQLVAHLYQVYALAFHAKMDCTFTACQAAAEYYDIIGNLLFFLVIVVDDYDVVTLKTGDGRYQG